MNPQRAERPVFFLPTGGAYLALNAQDEAGDGTSAPALSAIQYHKLTNFMGKRLFTRTMPSANGQVLHLSQWAQRALASDNHLPTSAQCDNCPHRLLKGSVQGRPRMSHAGTSGQCSSCHTRRPCIRQSRCKAGQPYPDHFPVRYCHHGGFVAWTPSVMSHAGLSGQCSTCHSGAYLPRMRR